MSKPVVFREAIRQSKPFESSEVEALLTLLWAEEKAAEIAYRPLVEADLTVPQYNVLRILRGSPDGLPTREVVDRMISRAPNITRLVDKLETKGYLKRCEHPCDRRVIPLRITKKGLTMVEHLDKPMTDAAAQAMSGLDADDLKHLILLLNRLGSSLGVTPQLKETHS